MKHVLAAIVLACVTITSAQAQSGASPFGLASSSQVNAIAVWEKLPESLRKSIAAQLAPLNEQQRRDLLASVPALKNLTPTQINAVLAYVEATYPAPVPVVDQEYWPTELGGGLPINSADFPAAAQSYTAGVTGNLTKVALLAATYGSATPLEIRELVGGVPGPTVLASTTFQTPLVDAFTVVEVTLPVPVPQQAGREYAIVMRPPSLTRSVAWRLDSTGYAGGNALSQLPSSTTTWYTRTTSDFAFRTYVIPSQ